jgi:hypothetical protein
MDLFEGASRATPPTHEERNAFILRRTLCAVSWIYAFWSALFGVLAAGMPEKTEGLYDPRLILLHAGLLGLAGTLQWKPRRGALAATLAAVAGSLFFAGLDLQRHHVETAFIDGAYAALAGFLLFKSRPPA